MACVTHAHSHNDVNDRSALLVVFFLLASFCKKMSDARHTDKSMALAFKICRQQRVICDTK